MQKPWTQRSWAETSVSYWVKSSPARSRRCHREVRGEGILENSLTAVESSSQPPGMEWTEPHRRGGTQHDTTGTLIAPSHHGAAQLGTTQQSRSQKMEKRFLFPVLAGETLLSCTPTDPNQSGQPLSYLDFADFDSGVIS